MSMRMKLIASFALAALLIVASCGPLGTKTLKKGRATPQKGPTTAPADAGATNGPQGTTEPAETIDAAVPALLTTLGSLLGLPVVGIGAGALWRHYRPARRFVNLVQAVQVARNQLKGHEDGLALAMVDKALAVMHASTEAAVRAVKVKQKIKSVSNPAHGE